MLHYEKSTITIVAVSAVFEDNGENILLELNFVVPLLEIFYSESLTYTHIP